MKRGEVWWVHFEPSLGGEIKKQRPAVIVSNNASNHYLNRVQVIPVTSNIERLFPSEAYISLNGQKRKAMADQVTTASKQRLIRQAGFLSPEDMASVDHALRVQLELPREQ